ncbi:MAG: hypothetical protein CM15mP84_04780 [Cellvibrionales bacterium]|nr:MAG: hypothetical protein CM15mP84_04780 [Cellvibrionales bacterium]
MAEIPDEVKPANQLWKAHRSIFKQSIRRFLLFQRTSLLSMTSGQAQLIEAGRR